MRGLIENKVIIVKIRKSAFLPNNVEMLRVRVRYRGKFHLKGWGLSVMAQRPKPVFATLSLILLQIAA